MANKILSPQEITKFIQSMIKDAGKGLSRVERKEFEEVCLNWLSASMFYDIR